MLKNQHQNQNQNQYQNQYQNLNLKNYQMMILLNYLKNLLIIKERRPKHQQKIKEV